MKEEVRELRNSRGLVSAGWLSVLGDGGVLLPQRGQLCPHPWAGRILLLHPAFDWGVG